MKILHFTFSRLDDVSYGYGFVEGEAMDTLNDTFEDFSLHRIQSWTHMNRQSVKHGKL